MKLMLLLAAHQVTLPLWFCAVAALELDWLTVNLPLVLGVLPIGVGHVELRP